jgi:hypothetical protein
MRITAGSFFAIVMASAIASAQSSLKSVTVNSSFEACSQVKIIGAKLNPVQDMEYNVNRYRQNMQRMPKTEFIRGISDPQSIASSIRLLRLVSDQKIANINTHIEYFEKIKSCLLKKPSEEGAECAFLVSTLKNEIIAGIPKMRRELALSVLPEDSRNYSSIPETHINAFLRPIPGLANPAGLSGLTPAELQTAQSDFSIDSNMARKEVGYQVAGMKDSMPLGFSEASMRVELLDEAYHVQRIRHQANYARILQSQPLLAFFEEGSLKVGEDPSFQEISNALNRLIFSAHDEIHSIQAVHNQKSLEFSRLDGEALWRGYIRGEDELLEFITSPVANDVLKTHSEYCAIAEQLLHRVSVKELQNFAITAILFGVGPTTGLLGLGIRGSLMAAQAVGIVKVVSVARWVKVGSNLSLAFMVVGNNMVHTYQVNKKKQVQEWAISTKK